MYNYMCQCVNVARMRVPHITCSSRSLVLCTLHMCVMIITSSSTLSAPTHTLQDSLAPSK